MNFTTLQRNVDRVIENLDSLVLDSAMELKQTMADLNVKQLEQGLRSDGKKITPKYQSKAYAKAKKAQGAIPSEGTPDLKLTGAFHSGIYAEKKGKEYIYLWSTDEKTDKLNAKYAKTFGLTTDSIGILKPDTTEILLKKITNELQRS